MGHIQTSLNKSGKFHFTENQFLCKQTAVYKKKKKCNHNKMVDFTTFKATNTINTKATTTTNTIRTTKITTTTILSQEQHVVVVWTTFLF